jgi:hypothetical protein
MEKPVSKGNLTVNSNLLIVRKYKATSRKRIPTLELNIATPELEIPMAPEAQPILENHLKRGLQAVSLFQILSLFY